MVFDSVSRIIYSVNWNAGEWALKVINPTTSSSNGRSSAVSHSVLAKSAAVKVGSRIEIQTISGILYDVKGRVAATRSR
jgi:hypothetical protein